MAITTGSSIGGYTVTSQLGEGGMGVVFRARDTKLLRDVALKLLPDHFADDPERLSRLQREAQILASVNHPNIAQIYGLEHVGSAGCIVMELVEGETLSERLKIGPLPLDEALEIAKQIADALAAAHERGIVHRDLKPANIKLTPNGTVKVLDFGLAKAVANHTLETALSTLPTRMSVSMPGAIVGTAAYMSPEQARGKEVDARTDVWAFGCVLYEMLTARKAFDGETATDMIAKIVTGQPDMNLLPPETPSSIRLLLEATLNKNIQQRLQHVGDMRLFLDPKFFPNSTPAATPHANRNASRGRLLMASMVTLLVAALIPAILYFRSSPPADAPPMHFEITLPGIANVLAVSPDGQRLAYVAQPPDDNRAIWIRPVGGETAQKLAGTDNGTGGLFWSPDSRYLAFVADGKLKKVDVLGGSVQIICDFSGPSRGFAWNQNGVILVAKDNGLVQVSDTGGEMKPFMAPDPNRKETLLAVPVFLPDGNHFLYAIVSGVPENAGFFVGSLDSQPPVRVMPLPQRVDNVVYAAPGYLLMSNANALTARRFDTSRFSVEGEPIPITDSLDGSFSVSATGLLFYRKGSGQPASEQLIWFDRGGKQIGQVGASGDYGNVDISPKNDRVAVDIITSNNRDIWVIDIARAVPSRITFDPGSDWSPSWSSDGNRIIFASTRDGGTHVYQKSSSGIGTEELVVNSDKSEVPVDTSPDDRYVVFSRPKPGGGSPAYDTLLLETSGEKKISPFIESPFDKVFARVSPDGRWIAYATNDSGMYQIVVQSFPDPNGGKWQITAQGGIEPKWRRDGRELYYLGLDGKLMAVPVKAESTFEAGTPVVLFETPLTVTRPQLSTRDRRYDVADDGRFLMVTPIQSAVSATVIAIVNWASGLEK